MMRALYTAASGMRAQQTNVDNISNNIANVNTTAFKSQKTEFKSLLYQTIQTRTTSANGENGFECTKVEDFVKAIEECQGEVEKLTEHAYQDILKMYNTKVMAEQYSKKYETAMNR